ncbi:unnamed protein product [Rhizophagus irregularis]|nr:unnamed protein product [Rhizophagus irregularis]
MNALYSGAMTQYMPTEIIGKVGPEEVPDIQTIAPDAEIGYMLEVDLEVPAHLHNFFADYPLAPEKQIVPENWLSPYNERLVHDKAVGVENIQQDETKGNPIGESVCLKPKMYSVLPAGHDPKTPETDADFEKELEEEEFRKSQGVKYWEKKHGIQKAKGVKKCVVKKELRHDKFLECLRTKKLTRHDMYGLRSYDHQIYLERVNKIGLNPYDNKRWILLDGIRTLPYGHWRIGLYKRLVASEIAPKEAEERAMKVRLRVKE